MMNESYDDRAKTWDKEPRRVQLNWQIFEALRKAVPLRPEMTLLDYGCGTGLLTLPLAAEVERITGVDTSAGMLQVLAQKAKEAQVGQIELLQSDFTTDTLPTRPYDLITSAMTLHHVADTGQLLHAFWTLLKLGGTLALADLDSEDGSFHGSVEGIPHAGFDRDDLSRQLGACGFKKIRFTTATRIEKNERTYPVFLVTARKP